MSSSALRSPVRQLLENRVTQLSNEVEALFAEARERSRRELADQLNQAVRRIRQSEDREALDATLLDAAASFTGGCAILHVVDGKAQGRRIRGVPEDIAESFKSLRIPLESAAALAGAIESRDPVIAAITPAEVSEELLTLPGHPHEGRVAIFPVISREAVPMLVYTWGIVQGSAVELLCQAAAGVWSEQSQSAAPVPAAAPDLVQIAPLAAAPVAPSQAASAWDRMTSEEQQVHLRAQRFARVQVAEMRLFEADSVQAGRTRKNLYEGLRPRIDNARDAFRQSFFKDCKSMVDYLHLEIVRTLANDDVELLGKDYPGPMA